MDIKDLNKNDVVMCSSQEESEAFEKLLHENGFDWASGESYLEYRGWDHMVVSYPNSTRIFYYVKRQIWQAEEQIIPNYFNIIPAFKFLDTLPKYWVVETEDSEKFDTIVDYLNEKYNSNWKTALIYTYFGFDGSNEYNGIDAFDDIKRFKNNPILLTVEEAYNLIKKEENMIDNRFPFVLKYEEAKKIIQIACPTWKKKLGRAWGGDLIVDGKTIISEDSYKEMRSVCTIEQHKLFDEIFGKDKQIPDKTPVYCWDDDDTHERTLTFYDAVNDGTFSYNGKRNGSAWHNYEVVPENEIPMWMITAKKTLED